LKAVDEKSFHHPSSEDVITSNSWLLLKNLLPIKYIFLILEISFLSILIIKLTWLLSILITSGTIKA